MAFDYLYSQGMPPQNEMHGISDLPVSQHADAMTLSRAVEFYSLSAPDSLKGTLSDAIDATRAYSRAQIELAYEPLAEDEHAAQMASQRPKVGPSEYATGEIQAVEHLGGRKPTLKELATFEALEVRRARIRAREAATELVKQPPFTPIQAAVAHIALRDRARQGDESARDMLLRHPDILKPKGGLVGRVVLAPVAKAVFAPVAYTARIRSSQKILK